MLLLAVEGLPGISRWAFLGVIVGCIYQRLERIKVQQTKTRICFAFNQY